MYRRCHSSHEWPPPGCCIRACATDRGRKSPWQGAPSEFTDASITTTYREFPFGLPIVVALTSSSSGSSANNIASGSSSAASGFTDSTTVTRPGKVSHQDSDDTTMPATHRGMFPHRLFTAAAAALVPAPLPPSPHPTTVEESVPVPVRRPLIQRDPQLLPHDQRTLPSPCLAATLYRPVRTVLCTGPHPGCRKVAKHVESRLMQGAQRVLWRRQHPPGTRRKNPCSPAVYLAPEGRLSQYSSGR